MLRSVFYINSLVNTSPDHKKDGPIKSIQNNNTKSKQKLKLIMLIMSVNNTDLNFHCSLNLKKINLDHFVNKGFTVCLLV